MAGLSWHKKVDVHPPPLYPNLQATCREKVDAELFVALLPLILRRITLQVNQLIISKIGYFFNIPPIPKHTPSHHHHLNLSLLEDKTKNRSDYIHSSIISRTGGFHKLYSHYCCCILTTGVCITFQRKHRKGWTYWP